MHYDRLKNYNDYRIITIIDNEEYIIQTRYRFLGIPFFVGNARSYDSFHSASLAIRNKIQSQPFIWSTNHFNYRILQYSINRLVIQKKFKLIDYWDNIDGNPFEDLYTAQNHVDQLCK